MQIVRELAPRLPEGFVAEPRVHLFPEQYAYEVLVFDLELERRLVAAVEIVSPVNKDRPESRQLFAAKCFNLLQRDVCVSIVDLVTIRQFSLYAELLALLGHSDVTLSPTHSVYAVTCRKRPGSPQAKVDSWFHPLAIGQPLPSLPLWLSDTRTVTLPGSELSGDLPRAADTVMIAAAGERRRWKQNS